MFNDLTKDAFLLFVLCWCIALPMIGYWHFRAYARIYLPAVRRALPHTILGTVAAILLTFAAMVIFTINNGWLIILDVSVGLWSAEMISTVLWYKKIIRR